MLVIESECWPRLLIFSVFNSSLCTIVRSLCDVKGGVHALPDGRVQATTICMLIVSKTSRKDSRSMVKLGLLLVRVHIVEPDSLQR